LFCFAVSFCWFICSLLQQQQSLAATVDDAADTSSAFTSCKLSETVSKSPDDLSSAVVSSVPSTVRNDHHTIEQQATQLAAGNAAYSSNS